MAEETLRARWAAMMRLALALVIVATTLVIGAGTASAERPYRARHFELGDLRRAELPWTAEPRLGFPARRPRDKHGVPMIVVNGRKYYRPGALAINSMKRLDAYIEMGDERHLRQALAQARRLRKLAVSNQGAWWVPFRYDYPPAAQRAPWVNAMSQGLVLSLFVRLYRLTGKQLHLDSARKVFRSFMQLRRSGGRFWVSYVTKGGYLWLEHYPRARPDHVLNAHLHAIFGIYEYWQLTRSRKAKMLLRGAITTMRDKARLFRRPGRTSRYDLTHTHGIVKYHKIHVWQLRLLGRISGDAYFWRLADRLAADVKPSGYAPGRPSVRRKPPWPSAAAEGLDPRLGYALRRPPGSWTASPSPAAAG
jgi:hypothetical protein